MQATPSATSPVTQRTDPAHDLLRDLSHPLDPIFSPANVAVIGATETPGSVGRTSTHQVGCLLPTGILHGSLEVLVNVRVSDFLRQQPGMAVLRECTLVPYGQPLDSTQARKIRCALVNLSRVSGVAEWLNQQV